MADGKKISFGFSKSTKKANLGLNSNRVQDKVELIDCVESQTIKIKDALEEIYTPLVIPMTNSNSVLLQHKRSRLKQEDVDERQDAELTPDELAARELIREAQNSLMTGESKINILPIVYNDAELNNDQDESTLEDYENVPISDYGLAMLRGMGWKEGTGIGKTKSITKVKEPNLRPKGMGLGANVMLNKQVAEINGEELVLKKGGYAKVIDGKQKGKYCEVQGFDDAAGRIIVKTTLQGLILALNEFLVIPVTKEEYIKSSKVINNAKYEEYVNKESHLSSSSQETSNVEKQDQQYKMYKSKSRSMDTSDRKKHRNDHNSLGDKTRSTKNERRKKFSNSSDSDQEYRKNNKERNKHRH